MMTRGRIAVEQDNGATDAANTPYFKVSSRGFVSLQPSDHLMLSLQDLCDLQEILCDMRINVPVVHDHGCDCDGCVADALGI